MYEQELNFLNNHIDLIEKNDFDRLFAVADLYCEQNCIGHNYFWGHILDIFYDKDVNINVFNGISNVPDYFHWKCTTCPKHILLKPEVTEIGYAAFYRAGIEKISGPIQPCHIKSCAFEDCLDLETVDFDIIEVGAGAFRNCRSLKEVKLADGLPCISLEAFNRCISLSSIQLPESVESIGPRAFWGCTGLKQINIPAGIKSIHLDAFIDCTNIACTYNNRTYTLADLLDNLDSSIQLYY